MVNGVATNITKVKAGYSYYLFMPSSQFQNGSISLNMNYMTNKPFSYVYIYEYSSCTLTNTLYSKYTSISISNKNNSEFFTSFKYSNNKYDIQYIALKITPNYDINLTAKNYC